MASHVHLHSNPLDGARAISTRWVRLVDTLGIWLSAICVVHCALTAGRLLCVYWLVAAASGADAYASAQELFASPLVRVLLVAFSFAFFYHLMNGVRHLAWDTGHGFEKKQARTSGWVAFLGAVAVQLVGKHIDSSVNNPIEAVAHWRGGKLKPLCVFNDKRMPYKEKLTGSMGWSDIPTCKEGGLDISYMMLRGIFMPAGVTQEQVQYYVDLFKKVQKTPEWEDLMEKGAFDLTSLEGKAYADWVAKEEARHVQLMKNAGFMAGK